MSYTEFYTQSGGSNLNAGSTTTASVYTGTGSWVQSTGVFTPTDGSTPASTVTTTMWGSIYITAGATVSLWVGRITAVGAGVNGAVTLNTGAGAKPADGTGTITLVVGGPWLGPNAASAFPFSLASMGSAVDATSHQPRVNMKNDQTYSITSVLAFGLSAVVYTIQGYTSSTGDGGKATWDGGTSTGALISDVGGAVCFIDHIFKTSITTGTTVDLVITAARAGTSWTRCVFTGARQKGLSITGLQGTVTECEAYDNNKNNNSSIGAFHTTSQTTFKNCIAHDNTGSNTSGFQSAATVGADRFENCIADTNGLHGIRFTSTSNTGQYAITNCDFYNNGTDGINIVSAATGQWWIENCNFIKNAGKGINNASVVNSGFLYNNGYGAGTQANGSANTENNLTADPAAVTYTSNLTPWVDPANGDFRINLAQAKFAGRGAFTETATSYAGTIGYPPIGAAPSNVSARSGGFA